MKNRSTARHVGMFSAMLWWASSARAEQSSTLRETSLDPITVTAKKLESIVPDDVLKRRVERALHENATFPDMHVDVSVKNGVAYIDGIVSEASDVTDAKRIAKRILGVKHVVCDLDINNGDID